MNTTTNGRRVKTPYTSPYTKNGPEVATNHVTKGGMSRQIKQEKKKKKTRKFICVSVVAASQRLAAKASVSAESTFAAVPQPELRQGAAYDNCELIGRKSRDDE